jgi:hypothetical protein
VATGPYAGTFTETGTLTLEPFLSTQYQTVTAFSATFTVYSTSGDVVVTGTKSLDTTVPNTSYGCADPPRFVAAYIPATYAATIYTPTGNYRDQGSSLVQDVFQEALGVTLDESFASSLVEPIPAFPTTKEQCKNGGWRQFPVFKNQGECVTSVAMGG